MSMVFVPLVPHMSAMKSETSVVHSDAVIVLRLRHFWS